ncbi:hypothetical protein CMQ_5896 [Grosmannia clavigera kw1407]|uniref:Uncharacterized protein n=1 Tax=Grosmannia clavigera (strain kw1407 / UAMH 11150) TaxID=655863 RepID=F0XIC5_GROCL|nr:uncharacterized protein CMQ_5896 [Grosmannia clavigera kw1407]EFX02535.1 hypothetical protein CMQ_5896 [Grosmannia clavigera kw1407]
MVAQLYKRKHGEVDEGTISEASYGDEEEGLRKRRSRSQNPGHMAESKSDGRDQDSTRPMLNPIRVQPKTPPIGRRTSRTPIQGKELQIPSRPATPNATRDVFLVNNAATVSSELSTAALMPKLASTTRSVATSVTLKTPKIAEGAMEVDIRVAEVAENSKIDTSSFRDLDEAEWAAFEADVVNAPSFAAVGHPSNAESIVASRENADLPEKDGSQFKIMATGDTQMKEEKEEANRALEIEFEEMVELESRVKKLREKREALRRKFALGPSILLDEESILPIVSPKMRNSKSKAYMNSHASASADEDDDEDDDDTDDWDGFRFRA